MVNFQRYADWEIYGLGIDRPFGGVLLLAVGSLV